MSLIKKMKKLFKKFGALSDPQIKILMGVSGNSIRPARGRLEKLGFIKNSLHRITNKKGGKNNLYQYQGD